jgi:hypothetical protein
MRSAALAFARQFHRHLWPLAPLTAYLVIMGLALPSIIGDRHVRFGDEVTAMVLVPWSILFFYFLAAFSFGLTGDLAARQSIYPARMFTLPITNAQLAGWPMLYGVSAMVALLLTTIMLSRELWQIDVPVLWPTVLGAVFLAWTQALTWMPYGLNGMRVLLTVAWLITLDAIVITAIELQISEGSMVAFLAPQLPLAYLTAWYAVARARRGEVPDWRVFGLSERRQQHQRAFGGPAQAQTWFEWRRGGRSLPMMVVYVLPFFAWLLFIPGNDTAPVVFATMAAMLLTPPVMAGFAAGMASTPSPHASDSLALSPIDATRPVTTATLVAAKLRTTLLSTAAAWLLVAIAIPSALWLSGTWPIVSERARAFIDTVGAPRAIASVLLALGLLMASTWKKQVQRLYIGLTGRAWFIKSSGFAAIFLLIAILPVIAWLRRDAPARVWLWEHSLLILAVLVAIKTCLAVWVGTRLYRTRLVADRILLSGAAGWLTLVLALYALFVWMIDTAYVPRYSLLLLAILAVPIARLSAAPLALDWNRHR